jgi:hypothetical protein
VEISTSEHLAPQSFYRKHFSGIAVKGYDLYVEPSRFTIHETPLDSHTAKDEQSNAHHTVWITTDYDDNSEKDDQENFDECGFSVRVRVLV